MSIALWNSMATLLGEDRHELLKRPTRLAKFELYLNSVAVYQIRSKRGIVERIIPIPANTAPVVIVEYPLQTFNIRLSDSSTKLSLVLWR